MASGNQVCKPNWADFPMAPITKNIPIKLKLCILNIKKVIYLLIKKGVRENIVA